MASDVWLHNRPVSQALEVPLVWSCTDSVRLCVIWKPETGKQSGPKWSRPLLELDQGSAGLLLSHARAHREKQYIFVLNIDLGNTHILVWRNRQ